VVSDRHGFSHDLAAWNDVLQGFRVVDCRQGESETAFVGWNAV
jgi:hypothetical protein